MILFAIFNWGLWTCTRERTSWIWARSAESRGDILMRCHGQIARSRIKPTRGYDWIYNAETNWIFLLLFFFQRDHILLEPTGTEVTNCVSKGKSQVSEDIPNPPWYHHPELLLLPSIAAPSACLLREPHGMFGLWELIIPPAPPPHPPSYSGLTRRKICNYMAGQEELQTDWLSSRGPSRASVGEKKVGLGATYRRYEGIPARGGINSFRLNY